MKLLLIDGHALAYRSYYAMIRNPLSNSRGENTSAEFGFVRGVLALLKERSPDALLVCFDPVGKSFRHEVYAQYKATRAKTPAELHASIQRIQGFLDAAGFAWISREGYEADDLLASAARQSAAAGWEVLLASGDKDLCQLVDERVHLLRPGAGAKPARELDPKGVAEEFGVPPEGILDYLSLVGDSADNLPGVPGLGPKTALKLLAQFGSFDAVFTRLPEVAPAGVRSKLESGVAEARLSRELASLVEDLDLGQGPGDWKPGAGRDPAALKAWLMERDFHSLVSEFEEGGSRESADYRLIQDEQALGDLVARLRQARRFAVDTETTGLDAMEAELVGISLSSEPGLAHYLPVSGQCEGRALPLAAIQRALGPLFADDSREKVAHNLKFDAEILARHGLGLGAACFDTMLASYCVDPSRHSHGLDSLALELLDHRMIPYDALFEKGDKERDIRRVALDRLGTYAAEDADYTLRLAEHLAPELAARDVAAIFWDLEMPLVPVLAAMEAAGIAIDRAQLAALSGRMDREREILAQKIRAAAGREFAIGSPKQIAEVLFDELKLPRGKRTKTGYSTDEEVLGELAALHPIAGWILEWREISKLKSTYVDVLPAMVHASSGRVHTSFNQAVAATGRLSSSDPNLQNIPVRSELGREIRRAFVAPAGAQLASFDYSQVELRILAHLSGDNALAEAFAAETDIHRWTAARLAGIGAGAVSREQRERAKMVNYGVLYGMGAPGLAARLRIPRPEAQRFIDEYFASFPGIRAWIDKTLEKARRDGAVTTLFGRRRAVPEIASANGRLRSFAERVAVNTPIQGSAADLIKRAMIDIHARLAQEKLASRMLLQVHDELLFEVPDGELERLSALVVEIMQGAVALSVPLKVDWKAAGNWLEAH